MKTLFILASSLIVVSLSSSVRLHEGAPLLSSTQNFCTGITASLCAQRAAEVFAVNGLAVSNSGTEHCFGGNNTYNVNVYCDQCGTFTNVVIAVASNGDGGAADALRDRLLEYIATGKSSATTGDGPRVWLDKTVFSPGEQITVYFTAPESYASNAWIGIIPSNIAHGDEAFNDQYDITYQYLSKKTSGTLTFTAPAAGSWDFRMHDTDNGGKEVAYVSFTVR